MSEDITLAAELRTNFGKGFARRLRAAGQIPAVIYGHGAEPVHVALPGHETGLIVRYANALIALNVEGKEHLVLVKDVQRDPVRQIIEHIDLIVVRRGEKMQVDVPLTLVGEPFSGTIATQDNTTLSIEVEATKIPQHIEVSIEGLEEGAHITAGDVVLPDGADLLTEPDALVVAISVPAAEEASETGADAGSGGAAEGASGEAAE